MTGLACVDVPALPLQCVLRAHPDWRDDAVVVVEADRPTAAIVWANRTARRHQIRPGMRLAHAQALAVRLHATVVPTQQIHAGVEEVLGLLIGFSPAIEPAPASPGLFWLDPNGLQHVTVQGGPQLLYPTLADWAAQLHRALVARAFTAAVVVGFHRYRLMAVARQTSGPLLIANPVEERRLAEATALRRLDLQAKLCDELALLGVQTLGDLLNIPHGDVATRYGEETARFCTLMREPAQMPLRPWRPTPPLRAVYSLEAPDSDQGRLLFAIKGLLDRLVTTAAARWQAVSALLIVLTLDHAPPHRERVEAAAPTRDAGQLLELVRLRLAATRLAAAVSDIAIELACVSHDPVQRPLATPRRDLGAAGRALARINAAFGAGAATVAEIKPAHLPEASFVWQPAQTVRAPQTQIATQPLSLVRGVLSAPQPLPPRPTHEPESWLAERGVVDQMWGPYRIAGMGWWQDGRSPSLERDYYFVGTKAGDLLWIYYDRLERRWFLHGYVA